MFWDLFSRLTNIILSLIFSFEYKLINKWSRIITTLFWSSLHRSFVLHLYLDAFAARKHSVASKSHELLRSGRAATCSLPRRWRQLKIEISIGFMSPTIIVVLCTKICLTDLDLSLRLSLRIDLGHVDVAERISRWKTLVLSASSVFLDYSVNKRKKTLHLWTSSRKQALTEKIFRWSCKMEDVQQLALLDWVGFELLIYFYDFIN